jgi:hypothetical protein|tara:strand:- start:866 stop:1096 length:231 start_codon:yes stop_codon:yes gene_type:complete
MIKIERCKEHNDQNVNCSICYPPIGEQKVGSLEIDSSAHKRIEGLEEQILKISALLKEVVLEIEKINYEKRSIPNH